MSSKKDELREKVNDAWYSLRAAQAEYGDKSAYTERAREYWMGLQVAWNTLFDGEEV